MTLLTSVAFPLIIVFLRLLYNFQECWCSSFSHLNLENVQSLSLWYLLCYIFHAFTVNLVSECWCPGAFHSLLPGCPGYTGRLPRAYLSILVSHEFSEMQIGCCSFQSYRKKNLEVRSCCISFLAVFCTIGHGTGLNWDTKPSADNANVMY